MRNLFIVAAKILGLFQFATALGKLDLSSLLMWKHDPSLETFLRYFAPPLLLGALGYVLVFKTAWLADKVGLADNTESPTPNRDDLLAVGLKLCGLYFCISFLAGVLVFLFGIMVNMAAGGGFALIMGGLSLFSLAVMLILSVLFTFRTNSMVVMLSLAESAPWRKVVVATLAVLVVILAVYLFGMIFQTENLRTFSIP